MCYCENVFDNNDDDYLKASPDAAWLLVAGLKIYHPGIVRKSLLTTSSCGVMLSLIDVSADFS